MGNIRTFVLLYIVVYSCDRIWITTLHGSIQEINAHIFQFSKNQRTKLY